MKVIKGNLSLIFTIFVFFISFYSIIIQKTKTIDDSRLYDSNIVFNTFDKDKQCDRVLHYSETKLHPKKYESPIPSSISGEENYQESNEFFEDDRNIFYSNVLIDYQERVIPNNQITQISKIEESEVFIGESRLFKYYYIKISFNNPSINYNTSLKEKETYVVFRTLKAAKEAKEYLIKTFNKESILMEPKQLES